MRFHFTTRELIDLLIAGIVLTIAFWNFWGRSVNLVEIIIGVTTGFVLHELAHKIVAQYMRYEAHFQKWTMGLILTALTSFMGFIFAAPGAVQIGPKIDLYGRRHFKNRDIGIIGLAGPLTNIILALFFIGLGFFYPLLHNVVFINLFLAGFNMIPFGPLDGYKVRKWSWWVWGLTVAVIIGVAVLFAKFI